MEPILPEGARDLGPAIAIVRVTVDDAGKVQRADLYRSTGYKSLDDAALMAAKASAYAPARKKCRNAFGTANFAIDFDPT